MWKFSLKLSILQQLVRKICSILKNYSFFIKLIKPKKFATSYMPFYLGKLNKILSVIKRIMINDLRFRVLKIVIL